MGTATGKADRIELLDALRGFALLGILLANMLYWSGWGAMTEEQRTAFAGAMESASASPERFSLCHFIWWRC